MVTTVSLPLLLGVQQVANYLGYHPNYVRDLLDSGELRGIRRGAGNWRIRATDLAAYIDSL